MPRLRTASASACVFTKALESLSILPTQALNDASWNASSLWDPRRGRAHGTKPAARAGAGAEEVCRAYLQASWLLSTSHKPSLASRRQLVRLMTPQDRHLHDEKTASALTVMGEGEHPK